MNNIEESNKGKNTWKIQYNDDYKIEKREVIYYGYYDDALKIYNPFNIKNIKITPISNIKNINYYNNYKNIDENSTNDDNTNKEFNINNSKDSLKKTLSVIYSLHYELINNIKKDIDQAIKNGNHNIVKILSINYTKEDVNKICYFLTNLDYTVKYIDEDRILKVSW